MTSGRFSQRMKSYDAWKTDIVTMLDELQHWLEQHDLSDAETDLRLYETMQALRQDRLTLAFVAEFSRGKTELINAIFFAGYGRRLLPSEAGRTTMCTTELFFDEASGQAFTFFRSRPDATSAASLTTSATRSIGYPCPWISGHLTRWPTRYAKWYEPSK
jgi:hypothetical protein